MQVEYAAALYKVGAQEDALSSAHRFVDTTHQVPHGLPCHVHIREAYGRKGWIGLYQLGSVSEDNEGQIIGDGATEFEE